jgi:hypothetical protein
MGYTQFEISLAIEKKLEEDKQQPGYRPRE